MEHLHEIKNPKQLAAAKLNKHYNIGADETVYMLIHKHWFVAFHYLFGLIFTTIVLIVISIASYMYLDTEMAALVSLVSLFLFHLSLLRMFWNWLDYYLDVIVITSERIIDVNQDKMFHRVVTEVSLNKIQDATGEISGFMREMMHYGSIVITVAGNENNLGMDDVPFPIEIASEIRRIQDDYMRHNYSINTINSV